MASLPTRVGEWASAGAIAATGLWIIGSYGFSIYLSRFAGYDQTYGSVGAIVVLLIWFRLGAYAVLLGVELNSEIERQRRPNSTLAAG